MIDTLNPLYTFYSVCRIAWGQAERLSPNFASLATNNIALTYLIAADCIATAYVSYRAYEKIAPLPNESKKHTRYYADRVVEAVILVATTVLFVKYSKKFFIPSIDLTTVLKDAGIPSVDLGSLLTATWEKPWHDEIVNGLAFIRTIFGLLLAYKSPNSLDSVNTVLQGISLFQTSQIRWIAMHRIYENPFASTDIIIKSGGLKEEFQKSASKLHASFYTKMFSLDHSEAVSKIKSIYHYSHQFLKDSFWSRYWKSNEQQSLPYFIRSRNFPGKGLIPTLFTGLSYETTLNRASTAPLALKNLGMRIYHTDTIWQPFQTIDIASSFWRLLFPKFCIPGSLVPYSGWFNVGISDLKLSST
jgi:hypothetical protein